MIYFQKDFPLRTKEMFENDAINANVNEPVNGLKGPIKISKIISLPDSIPIDYMHLVCLGLFKSILGHWFDSSNNKQKFYIGKT